VSSEVNQVSELRSDTRACGYVDDMGVMKPLDVLL
jgi:hypothetical protein